MADIKLRQTRTLLVFAGIALFPLACNEGNIPSREGAGRMDPARSYPLGAGKSASEYKTRTGKTIVVSESHPVGQSLSTIEISTRDFEHNRSETYEDRDPISDALMADLDGNGFDEIYIITTSAGSGSYGSVLGLASNRDRSLSLIHFPEVRAGDESFAGYMGHDVFSIKNRKLVRIFPVYVDGDTNRNPTGGKRKLTYGLHPGEAMWQLKIEKSEAVSL